MRTLAVLVVLTMAGAAGAREERPKPTRDTVLGGQHWRISGEHGTVHVWRPAGYHKRGAGIVVYVHGYGSSADKAWTSHRLAEQFRESRQNALFIVPDAPAGRDEGLKYEALGDLLKTVFSQTRIARPPGPIVVVGHSGAFRTIVPWLDYRAIDHVLLLDALYARQANFADWLETAKGHEHNKLTIVGKTTAENVEAFLGQFPDVVRMNKVPQSFKELDRRQKRARILYVKSQFEHMQIVTSGKVIPLLLRRTPLRPI